MNVSMKTNKWIQIENQSINQPTNQPTNDTIRNLLVVYPNVLNDK